MDFIRIRTLPQLDSFNKDLMGLFYEYANRTELWKNANELYRFVAQSIMFSDHVFCVFIIDKEIVGFLLCNLLGNSKKSILYVDEFYCPKHGMKAWDCMRAIARTFGVNELWGKAEEKIYRTYRKHVKNADVSKQQIVRVKLWVAGEVNQKASQDR